MKRLQTTIITTFTLLLISFSLPVQENQDILDQVQKALKSSNSNELAKHLNDRVKIKLDNNRKEYSINQAKIVLKDFFEANPADTVSFDHNGNSPGGSLYAIGTYTSGTLEYRVVARAKKYKGVYKIYHLELSNSR